MHELGHVKNFTETEFIYGECFCPILEDPKDDCVRNDREKLVENDKSQALLEWICTKVNELADKMAAKSVESQRVEGASPIQRVQRVSELVDAQEQVLGKIARRNLWWPRCSRRIRW